MAMKRAHKSQEVIKLSLEDQLLYNQIYVTDSLHLSRTHFTFSFIDHITIVVDRFERSLRFCHLEFDKEAISDC